MAGRNVTLVSGYSSGVTLDPGQVSALRDDAGNILTDDDGATLTLHADAMHVTGVTVTDEG